MSPSALGTSSATLSGSEMNLDELVRSLVSSSPGELERALMKLGFPPLSGQTSTDDLAAGSTPNLAVQERLQEKLVAISSLRGDAERLRKEMYATHVALTLQTTLLIHYLVFTSRVYYLKGMRLSTTSSSRSSSATRCEFSSVVWIRKNRSMCVSAVLHLS